MSRAPREDRTEAREQTGRRQRIPLGAPTLRLNAESRPGFVRRWVNDDKGRLDRAEQAGYAFVQDKEGQTEKRLVGTKENGSELHAYLMEQKQEYYAEDQALKEQQNAQVDEAINRGRLAPNVQSGADGADRFYGEGSIKHS